MAVTNAKTPPKRKSQPITKETSDESTLSHLQQSSPTPATVAPLHPDELYTESPKTSAIYAALAAFQSAIRFVGVDSEGYGYNYASLPAIWDTIDPHLKKIGLLVIQANHSHAGQIGVYTRIVHIKSGEWIAKAFTVPIPMVKGTNAAQAAGSGITYTRRYALATLLGLIVDPDDDGTASE